MRAVLRSVCAAAVAAWCPAQATAPAPTTAPTPAPSAPAAAPTPDAVELGTPAAAAAGLDRALQFLVDHQHPDGSWGTSSCDSLFEVEFSIETHHAYQVAAHGLALLALLQAPETPARRQALEKAVRWLCTSPMTRRGNDWDNDAVWGWLYGTVALTAVATDRRFDIDAWHGPVHARGREFAALLERNQVPAGGFGYYDDPTFTQRPKWATSFATSSVLPSLGLAMQLGWVQDAKMRDRCVAYVKRCRLPNGAYEYDLSPIPRVTGGPNINHVKGSLGRIQVCNWALRQAGDRDLTDDVVRQGLQQFFTDHRFLQIARMRPIPHEAYYQNAGYFYFFGHYYCALAINLLPAAEREGFHAQLRPHILQAQRPDGSFCDFLGSSYQVTASTAFAALTLRAGL